jgi:hypothetical protein
MSFPILRRWIAGLLFVPVLAWGASAATGLPANLESKAKLALANIAKAKSALNAGDGKTSQSYLAKAEGLLKSVLGASPTTSAPTQNTNALSDAESEAAKLNPSLAARVGVGNPQAAQPQGTADGGPSGETQAPQAADKKSAFAELKSTYEKVTLAQSLLKGGDSAKAKGILDAIPTSPLSLVKSAASGH